MPEPKFKQKWKNSICLKKYVSPVVCLLLGEKNGLKFGRMWNIAVNDAEGIKSGHDFQLKLLLKQNLLNTTGQKWAIQLFVSENSILDKKNRNVALIVIFCF